MNPEHKIINNTHKIKNILDIFSKTHTIINNMTKKSPGKYFIFSGESFFIV